MNYTPVGADLVGGGMGGKPWVLAMHRINWDFGKTTINILMISVVGTTRAFR